MDPAQAQAEWAETAEEAKNWEEWAESAPVQAEWAEAADRAKDTEEWIEPAQPNWNDDRGEWSKKKGNTVDAVSSDNADSAWSSSEVSSNEWATHDTWTEGAP